MGVMICEKHGRVGFVETCAHIGAEVTAGRMPGGHRLDIAGEIWLCADCYQKLEFGRFANLAGLPLEELVCRVDDDLYEASKEAYARIEGRQGFCLRCVAGLEQRS